MAILPVTHRYYPHSEKFGLFLGTVAHAGELFSVAFSAEMNTKVYCFIMSNKQLLWERNFSVAFTGTNAPERQLSFKEVWDGQNLTWPENDDLFKKFGVGMLIVGIAKKPNSKNIWRVSVVQSYRNEKVEFADERDYLCKGFNGMKIGRVVQDALTPYCVPKTRIAEILKENS